METDQNEATSQRAKNRKSATPATSGDQPDIFTRLKQRGVNYERIMEIVTFSFPQNPFFFARQFGTRSIKEVLRHIESWKRFLNEDYLLSDELKVKVNQWIQWQHDMVWRTVQSVNPQVGDWRLHWYFTPIGIVETADGERLPSGMKVVATNVKTGEVRTHEIDGRRCSNVAITGEVFTEIYTALGIFDQLWLGATGPLLMSRRSRQGWPVYSRMIPWLYDFLAPYYNSPAHHSEQIDLDGRVRRSARYPKPLLDDMLEILRLHHPNTFTETTTNQLKAAISRHLSRKPTKATRRP